MRHPVPLRTPIPAARGRTLFVLLAGFLLAAPNAWGVDVLTVHYNNARTGANPAETVLNQGNVNVGAFGKLYTRALDGYNYAQPLYVSGVSIGGGTHNVVYVATEHNTVYAFDADDATGGVPAYWTVNFGPAVPYLDVYTNSDTNITPEVGITGTPVIDKTTNTLYVVSFSKDAGPTYNQRLHAIDLSSGAEKFGGPTLITYAQSPAGHLITFNPRHANQRPGLALANNSVYIAWASFGDISLGEAPETTYHGYVMRYSASTLQQQAVFVASPSGTGNGIWQVGCGPGVDADGNVYVVTGNGTCDTNLSVNGPNYGESAVKLTPGLAVADFFTPYNQQFLNDRDLDLGVAGHVLVDLPNAAVHKHLFIHGSKEGNLYVLDRDNMGHFHAGDDSQIVQTVHPINDEVRSTPVYWTGPNGDRIFVNGQGGGGIFALSLSGDGLLSTAPVATGHLLDNTGFRGSHMVVSSNGTAAGTGVVWTFSPTIGDPVHQVGPGVFRAFSADNLQELYNSQQNPTRDYIGNYPKYVPPTVANGRVYVPTSSGQLHVFGLVPTNPGLGVAITSPANNASAAEPANIAFTASAAAGSATVAKVAYLYGTTLIGQATTAPYTVNWTSVFAGTYTIFALVTDSNGATATSAPITINITGTGGTGTILRQVWTGIGGVNVSDLTSIAAYPNSPNTQGTVTSFEGPVNADDNYGSRILGYVYPPISGAYTFWIASDDGGELWLSSDDNPANKAKIATVASWTNSEEWTKFPSQQSAVIPLVGGQRYYIEALMKEGGGGDNLAVGWQLPTGQLERPIGGAHLSPGTPAGTASYGMPYRGTLASLNVPSNLGTAPPATLSATGAFANTSALIPTTGIVPYTPITPLWSDAALKSRWIALPAAKRIIFAPTGEWSFPGGTVFIKHFELSTDDTDPTNPAKRRRLETRLLVLDNTGGNGYGITYRWRADNTDADLISSAGLDEDITIATAGGSRTQTWHYPSQTECLQCHTTNAGFVLGAKTRQLNSTLTYPGTGIADNQLRTWNYLRMFTNDIGEAGIPNMSKMVAVGDTTATLENRVKSYIDANCGQCHRSGGIAGWDARYDLPMNSQGIINTTPLHGDLGATGAKIVAPVDTAHSVLRLRMASQATGTKMPPLARNLVDASALAVVDQWINSLPGGPANTAPVVNAGADLAITLPSAANLVGTASDDGLPAPANLTVSWSTISGTGTVVFGAANALSTSATFSAAGSYTLRLTASDGALATSDDVVVTVAAAATAPAAPTALNALASSSSQIALAWTDNASNETGFKIERKIGAAGTYGQIATAAANATSYGDSGLTPQTQYYYRVRATNAVGDSAYSNEAVATTPAASGLPSPWQDQDIGAVGLAGSAAYNAGTFSVTGSGDDIWNNADAFNYVWQTLNGDGQIVARVASITNTDGWAKAGVMMRETLTAGSTHAMMAITIANGAAFQRRLATGGASTHTAGAAAAAPYWVKLVRAGTTFTGYQSVDGANWVQVGNDTIAMAATIDIGLAVTAHNKGAANTATFTNVAISGGAVANTTPTVNAGPDLAITLPATASLAGTASDDGLPAPANLTTAWSVVSGPATVAFASPSTPATTATFAVAGSYVLRLTASDGALTSSDDVAVTVNPAATGGSGTGLTGAYFTNQLMTFTGVPTLTRTDATIDFDWGGGAPDLSISVDHFTVRWTGQVQAQFGETYTFFVTGDDGVRLTVNNQLLIDKWIDQGPTEWSGAIALAAGQKYDLKLEYYENGGGAVAKLAWSSSSTTKQTIPQVRLFPASGAPANVAPTVNAGADLAVIFPAGASLAGSVSDDGLPNPPGAVATAWSMVSGPGTVTFANATALATSATFSAPGSYTLRLTANDGALAGSDDVVVTVGSGPVVGTGTGLTGSYFTNQSMTFTGAPTLVRTDATVNFNWGNGSPDASISVDHFTARWTGQVQAQTTGAWTFFVTGDDGVRLTINGQLLIDKWIDQAPAEYGATIALTAGQSYPIQLDYYENGGGAVAMLAWSGPSVAKQIIPQSQLYPAATPPTIVSGGIYTLAAKHSSKLLDEAGGGTADGTIAIQWPANGGQNQQWRIDALGGGIYRLTSVLSGKVLEVNGASVADGAVVDQWTDTGADNERWMITDMGGGFYKLVNVHSGKSLEVGGASTADAAAVDQATDNAGDHQRWSIVMVPPTGVAGELPIPGPLAGGADDAAGFSGRGRPAAAR